LMLTTDPERALVIDQVDSRVLGAVRFADATTQRWVTSPLDVTAPGATLLRNRSGAYVIAAAAGLEPYLGVFALDLAALPAGGPVTVTMTVRDPTGHYLARTVDVTLPRDPDPDGAAAGGSLFRAVQVPLYPAPAAP